MMPFSDPAVVAGYTEATPKKVPGLADPHRMAAILLAERAPGDADILVVGAGGGLELRAFAESQPGWRFLGVDPSAEMLDLARRTLAPHAPRADLRLGTIDAAPVAGDRDWEYWYTQADTALYRAKRLGGDRVEWQD